MEDKIKKITLTLDFLQENEIPFDISPEAYSPNYECTKMMIEDVVKKINEIIDVINKDN